MGWGLGGHSQVFTLIITLNLWTKDGIKPLWNYKLLRKEIYYILKPMQGNQIALRKCIPLLRKQFKSK